MSNENYPIAGLINRYQTGNTFGRENLSHQLTAQAATYFLSLLGQPWCDGDPGADFPWIFSFDGLSDEETASKKTGIELVALGHLFLYNQNPAIGDKNAPYSPGAHWWIDNGNGTQSYYLYLNPPATRNTGGTGQGSVTPSQPPPPAPPVG
jgi:hypothetical protein